VSPQKAPESIEDLVKFLDYSKIPMELFVDSMQQVGLLAPITTSMFPALRSDSEENPHYAGASSCTHLSTVCDPDDESFSS